MSSNSPCDIEHISTLFTNLFHDNSDKHYTHDQIDQLMQQYFFDNQHVRLFAPLLGTNWQGQNHLRDQLIAYQQQRMQQIEAAQIVPTDLLIPVNLNQDHWVLLNIRYQANSTAIENVFYFDPLGSSSSENLLNLLRDGVLFPNLEAILEQPNHILQNDTYNCGPWIIAIADFWINEGRMPQAHEINIEAVREQHKQDLEIINAAQPNPGGP